jgi:hypothetical protein
LLTLAVVKIIDVAIVRSTFSDLAAVNVNQKPFNNQGARVQQDVGVQWLPAILGEVRRLRLDQYARAMSSLNRR